MQGSRNTTIAAALALSMVSGPALAADLSITGVDDESALFDALRGGSLLAEQTDPDAEPATAQELVAAAQADYGRLLAVLYDNGYFGPTLKITLDGVDAAAIPPVRPPRRIDRAVISVDPGPKFRFGATRIAPVAPGTELPEEFATGQTASLGVLKDTVASGIEGWRAVGPAKADLAEQEPGARGEGSEDQAR